MEKHHTIVIGAGPGGLSCATILAREGVDVLLLERKQRVGPKVCAGGVPWSGLSQRIPASIVEKSFNEQYVRSDRQQITIKASAPIISTVNREKLGQWMLEQAVNAGVQVRTGSFVRKITDQYVATDEDRFGYRFLVGADGSSSIVRKHLQIGTKDIGTGIHYQAPGDFKRMEWHLDTELFRSGYAWIFPHHATASIGAYAGHNSMRPKKLLANLHKWTRKRGIDLKGVKTEAALINFDFRGWRFNNKFLVGDAAGLTSGLTGEGIYPAIISGEATAMTILDSRYDAKKLKRIIRKHHTHRRLQILTAKNKVICKIALETLVMALRMRLIDFKALEMGRE